MVLTEQKPVEDSPLVERGIEPPRAGANEVRVCAVCRADIHVVVFA